jgi:hypothetical protein
MRGLLLALALLALGACQVIQLETKARYTVDPVVVVHGPDGDELGVSTDYGIVFLGKTARSGRVDFTVWFGDGPAREEGLVEAMGGGIYATAGEILLPCVALRLETPPPGSKVMVRGRRGGVPYEVEAQLASDPRVTGVLLAASAELDQLGDDQLGAGVFYVEPAKPVQLVGLLRGRVELGGRRYVTAVGPEDLWRLIVQRRNSDRPRRWVYRQDIM